MVKLSTLFNLNALKCIFKYFYFLMSYQPKFRVLKYCPGKTFKGICVVQFDNQKVRRSLGCRTKYLKPLFLDVQKTIRIDNKN